MKLFGLTTCDTCRKARKALEAAGHTVTFRDVRDDPLDAEILADLLTRFGDALINTRSTTWRGLGETERARPPLDLLADHPTLMKRPVIVNDDKVTLGWAAAQQAEHLG